MLDKYLKHDVALDDSVLYICTGWQMAEHILALWEHRPGTIYLPSACAGLTRYLRRYGYPTVVITPEIKEQISLCTDKDIVYESDTAVRAAGLGGRKQNAYHIHHGVSEKCTYENANREPKKDGRASTVPFLQLSRHLRGTLEFTEDTVRHSYMLDDNKPTLLYIVTHGRFCASTHEVYDELVKLSRTYNIIIKPHSLTAHVNLHRINEICPIYWEYHALGPFIEVADIIMGDISAGTMPANAYIDKPLILNKLKRDMSAGSIKDRKNASSVLTEEHCQILCAQEAHELPSLLERAHEDNKGKKKARELYHKNWFGTHPLEDMGRLVTEAVKKNTDSRYILDEIDEMMS